MASKFHGKGLGRRTSLQRLVKATTWESDLAAALIACGSFATVVCVMLVIAP